MKLKTRLTRLAAAIAEQASKDPEFASKIEEIMGCRPKPIAKDDAKNSGARKGGRRAPAVIDPVAMAETDPQGLRKALEPLSSSQLLDIVAEYGMDPGKLVMKWKDRDKIIERIVDISMSRATKGDAFRST